MKNEVACAARILIPSGRLVLNGGTGGVADSMGSCTVAVRGVADSTKGGMMRELAEALGDIRADAAVVEPGRDACNATVTRSIKGSNVPNTSSNTPDIKNKAGIYSRGKVTSGISNSPSTIKITWG